MSHPVLMSQPLGYNFAPTLENNQEFQHQPDQAQRAIQTLSFQLPRFAGAGRRLSPLQGQAYAGSPISQAVLQSVLRTILGPEAVSGSFADPNASSDPAGVRGPSEFSPALLQGLSTGPSRAPTIHPGEEGRLPLMGGEGAPSLDVPFFDRTGQQGDGSGQPSPYQSWLQDERNMGRYQYLSPDFGGTPVY